MVDLTGILSFFSDNLLNFAVIFIIIFAIYYLFFRGEKKDKFKPLILAKEVRKDLKSLFDLTEETFGYGKSLYIGSRFAGFVLNSIFINYYDRIEDTIKIAKLKEKYPEAKELVEKKYKELEHKPFYAFKICGKGKVSRFMASWFDIGIKYILVDKSIIEEDLQNFKINPYSQPSQFLDVYIFSSAGKKFIDDIAYKIALEQQLESFANWIPKMTFHEIEQAKGKASLDSLEQIYEKRKKESIDELIKKG